MGRRKDREAIEGPGLRIERVGRHIVWQSFRTPEEHRELQERLAKTCEDIPKRVDQMATELDAILLRYDSFDIIANLIFTETSIDPETYKEPLHEGRAVYMEYVALRCLSRPYTDAKEQLPPDGPTLDRIKELLGQIFAETLWYYIAEGADPSRAGPPSALENLRFTIINEQLHVRTPWYHHHYYPFLRKLFEPFDGWFLDRLGFSMSDAIEFTERIPGILTARLIDRRNTSRESGRNTKATFRHYRNTGERNPSLSPELLEVLSRLPERKVLKFITNLAIMWTFTGLGRTLSLSAEELADATQRPVNRAAAFFRTFSVDFGAVPPQVMLQPLHPLHLRPFVHHNGRYLPAGAALLDVALRYRAEDLLNPDSGGAVNTDRRLWERYGQNRKQLLETETLRLFRDALRTHEVYRNLTYTIFEGGTPKQVELDGLVLYDRTAFLIEAKSGGFTAPARRGAQKRLLDDVRKLVADAHAQGLRAARYISESADPVFQLPDGAQLHIDKSRLKHAFLATVTLDQIGTFTANLAELAELGIFPPGDLPWAVSLGDLYVIAELVEFPFMLVHYLLRRLSLNTTTRIRAHDELDWFGHYLEEGLYLKAMDDPRFNKIWLTTRTTIFDDYYLFVTGVRETPTPRPVQPMPDLMRRVLSEIAQDAAPGHVTLGLALLDMDEKARRRFTKWFERAQRRAGRDRLIHDFSFAFSEAKAGITVMAAPPEKAGLLPDRLTLYCQVKKYETRSDTWVGLGTVAGDDRLVPCWIVHDSPWKPDASLEDALQLFRQHVKQRD